MGTGMATSDEDKREAKEYVRTAYDTLFGYLQSVGDVYARALLTRHLDRLYEGALNSLDSASTGSNTGGENGAAK